MTGGPGDACERPGADRRPAPQKSDASDASEQDAATVTTITKAPSQWVPVLALCVVGLAIAWALLADGSNRIGQDRTVPPPDTNPGDPAGQLTDQAEVSIPEPLLAAEWYVAQPSAESLRRLFVAVGGFDGLVLGTVEGAFDLVRFNPRDSQTLLAARRSSYGEAENQDVNEIWQLTATGRVSQTLWAADRAHDFAHYNVDGTTTTWVHGGGPGFAPRSAVVQTGGAAPAMETAPMYASRFSVASGTVFALTGSGDYYDSNAAYVDLVADRGAGVIRLDDGASYGWIDNPTPDLLIAYPQSADGVTSVWNVETLTSDESHPLSGRPYRRATISGDRSVAAAATFDGGIDVIDLTTGTTMATFGDVDVGGVDQPLTLNHDGSITVTIERNGRVTIWWTGDPEPVATTPTRAGQPRWVSAPYAAISTSTASADTRRLALATPARAGVRAGWTIVDTDPDSWVARACLLAGRVLTASEERSSGLAEYRRACQD